MRWLTDNPETAAGFLPSSVCWQPAGDLLTESDRALAPWLAEKRPLWLADVEEADARYARRRWVVIDHAEQSQFSALLDALKEGLSLPDGLVALALTGRRFHGQRQRPWSAVRGNLHLTVHYPLTGPADRLQAGLAMAPAVAVAEAIQAVSAGRLQPAIKWTNDVLINGCKVAGVLTSTTIENRQIQHVLFGVGVNVASVPDLVPSPWAPPPGALAAFDPALAGAMPSVLAAVVRALDDAVELLRVGDSASLFERYRNRAAFLNRDVSIWPDASPDGATAVPLARGRVVELHPDLSLRLAGVAAPVTSGRMVLEDGRGWRCDLSGKP